MKKHHLFFLAILILVSACSRIAYNTLQNRQDMDCQKMEGSVEQEECRQRSGMSYDEYQRQLNEREQNRSN